MTVRVSIGALRRQLVEMAEDDPKRPAFALYVSAMEVRKEAQHLEATSRCPEERSDKFIYWTCCDVHRNLDARSRANREIAHRLAPRVAGGGPLMSPAWWASLGIDSPDAPSYEIVIVD
jgi:hypothetical protein